MYADRPRLGALGSDAERRVSQSPARLRGNEIRNVPFFFFSTPRCLVLRVVVFSLGILKCDLCPKATLAHAFGQWLTIDDAKGTNKQFRGRLGRVQLDVKVEVAKKKKYTERRKKKKKKKKKKKRGRGNEGQRVRCLCICCAGGGGDQNKNSRRDSEARSRTHPETGLKAKKKKKKTNQTKTIETISLRGIDTLQEQNGGLW